METSGAAAAATAGPVFLVPFARSVVDLLRVWPALQLSLEQSASHQTQTAQEQARAELATELVGAFLDAQPLSSSSPGTDALDERRTMDHVAPLATPEAEEIEDFLLAWIFGSLDVRIEDDSEIDIARDLLLLWHEWSAMSHPSDQPSVYARGQVIQRIDRLAANRRSNRSLISAQFLDEGLVSDDDAPSLSDNDHAMNIDQQEPSPQPHPSPTVDQEGFTLVTKSTRRH
ncbi:hypothetical protein VP01_1876g7 [Puccinia sorghi]|uniref:Uncharacterized protein n=1 Tax=Puccinia sorghi TaxID=27349 RepID=A0A0L6VDA5_9BASI|nr:hypothetical protein VP01_1876g7 [Puccinia sorghi]